MRMRGPILLHFGPQRQKPRMRVWLGDAYLADLPVPLEKSPQTCKINVPSCTARHLRLRRIYRMAGQKGDLRPEARRDWS
jgi:hypothetical protein